MRIRMAGSTASDFGSVAAQHESYMTGIRMDGSMTLYGSLMNGSAKEHHCEPVPLSSQPLAALVHFHFHDDHE